MATTKKVKKPALTEVKDFNGTQKEQMTEKKSTTSSMDIFDVTTIVFFINKLAGVAPMADWSWWVVFSPLLGQIIFIVAVAALAAWFGADVNNVEND